MGSEMCIRDRDPRWLSRTTDGSENRHRAGLTDNYLWRPCPDLRRSLTRFVDWTIPDVVYLARVATELGDASGADLCSAGRHPGGGSSARRAGGPVGGQFRSRGRTTSHTVSPTRTSNSTPIASHPSEPIPFPKPPIIGELLLRLPSSSGKPPVSQPGAAFAVRNHGATMKETGHGQPGRGGANRDGRVPCVHSGEASSGRIAATRSRFCTRLGARWRRYREQGHTIKSVDSYPPATADKLIGWWGRFSAWIPLFCRCVPENHSVPP